MSGKFKTLQEQVSNAAQVPEAIALLAADLKRNGYKVVSHSVWVDYHSPSSPIITVLGEKNA